MFNDGVINTEMKEGDGFDRIVNVMNNFFYHFWPA